MNTIQLGLIVGSLMFVALAPWYLRANRSWTRLLSVEDQRLAYDPVRDPGGWFSGGTFRLSTWLARLRVPDKNPEIEHWRVRTLNRFVVWLGLSAAAFLVGGELVRYVVTFARASIERFDSGFGVLLVVVVCFVLLYYSAQLARTLIDFGNGRRPTVTELAVTIAGITAALIGMAIMPSLDLSKP
jgi:hypothetical protein